MIKAWGLEKFPYAMVVLDLILVSVFYSLVIAHFPTQNGDNIEHIHSSFLIANGSVPYRDFFQHHNPLLWYIFAPLVKFFQYNTTIAEIVCFISFLVFLKSLVYVYRICEEFLTDKFWALMATAMVAIPMYKLCAIDFRPDNYMVFCLIAGIYYFFSYLRDKKQGQLSVSFVFWFVSFLFAQKAVFPLLCMSGAVLYFLYKKEIPTRMFLKALFWPFLGGIGFLYYLYHYEMIELYYKANYTFNLNLVEGFDMHRVNSMPWVFLTWVCIGMIGGVFSLFSINKYWKVVSFLFITEFFQRKFYFSPYIYYYWFLIYLAVLTGVPLLNKIDNKNRLVRLVFVSVLYFALYKSALFYWELKPKENDNMYLPDFITRQINPCDYVFNGDGYMYNLFGKDPHYYWQLIGQLDVIGEKTGVYPRPDMNELILKFKPKFVYGRSYFHKFSSENGRNEIVHYIDSELINKYYDFTGYGNVYVLKSEYDNRTCQKDSVDGDWYYKN